MNILILSDYFEPVNKIASIRLTNIANQLIKLGNDVTVITLDSKDFGKNQSKCSLCKIKRISVDKSFYFFTYRLLRKISKHPSESKREIHVIQQTNKKKKTKIKKSLAKFYYQLLSWSFDKGVYKSFYKFITKNIDLNHYDFLFSSYGGLGSYICAGKIVKKKQQGLKWVADFRDYIFDGFYPKNIFDRRKMKSINKWKDFLSGITCVCGGIKDVFSNVFCVKKPVLVLENGFEKYIQYKENKTREKFIVSYCGSLYSRRKFDSIFCAFDKLIKEQKDNSVIPFEIRFCGNQTDFNKFFELGKKYNLENVIKYFGNLTREESLIIESDSDALILSSWNSVAYRDVMTGKFFEYLSLKKPILCHISGDLPGSLLQKYINENHLGFCFEESAPDQDKMNKYVRQIFINKMNNIDNINDSYISFADNFQIDKLISKFIVFLNNL